MSSLDRFDGLLADFLEGSLSDADAAELLQELEQDAERRRTAVELYQQSRQLQQQLGSDDQDFAAGVLAELQQDRRQFVGSVIEELARRSRRRLQVSRVAAAIFAVLWLISAAATWTAREAYERSQTLLDRKRVDALAIGDTVPDLKARRRRLEGRIARLKKLMGYHEPGKSADQTPTDRVIDQAVLLLDRYYDDAVKSRARTDRVFLCQRENGKAWLKIGDERITVPLMGQPVDPDKLVDTQYLLNLENVSHVLRQLHQRLTVRRERLRQEIARLEARLATIRTDGGERARVLRRAVADQRKALDRQGRERRRITRTLGGQVTQAERELARLRRELLDLDRRLRRADAEGERRRKQLLARIRQANVRRGHVRRKLGRAQEAGYGDRAALIASTIEQDEPDASVTLADASGVWIDRGKRDGMRAGLIFLLCSPAPGGYWRFRGRVQVVRVTDGSSRVRLLEQASKDVRPTRGDKLFNKIFRTRTEARRRGPVRVAFIGKFPRSGARLVRLRELLVRSGARVDPKLTHFTSLIVVEQGYEADPSYLKATEELHVDVLTTEQLREFIAY